MDYNSKATVLLATGSSYSATSITSHILSSFCFPLKISQDLEKKLRNFSRENFNGRKIANRPLPWKYFVSQKY